MLSTTIVYFFLLLIFHEVLLILKIYKYLLKFFICPTITVPSSKRQYSPRTIYLPWIQVKATFQKNAFTFYNATKFHNSCISIYHVNVWLDVVSLFSFRLAFSDFGNPDSDRVD